MSEFGKTARELAGRLSYTEWDAEELAKQTAKAVGDEIALLNEPRMDELWNKLGRDAENVSVSASEITPKDVALAAWSSIDGNLELAIAESTLGKDDFIVLHDSLYIIEDGLE